MAILFHPRPGHVLVCNYDTGFRAPEMIKNRPVVVVSRGNAQLTIVVPLSTTEPTPLESWHVEMSPASLPETLRGPPCWAKCDMVGCVGLWRLDRVRGGKSPKSGKRIYVTHHVSATDPELIRQALRTVLQL